MKCRFIDIHRHSHAVTTLCHVLNVSTSGYYAAHSRKPSARSERQAVLTAHIREIHTASRYTYGAPRIHAERPNVCWLSDITYIPTREGWLYLAAILDVYSRAVVGWGMSKNLDSKLAMDALNMAVCQRGTGPDILHSDQGSTYAASEYRTLLSKYNIRQSMSRKGDCWDNAPMESFFHTLKTDLVMHCDYKTRDQARASLFEYMEVFYNRQRRHSTISYEAPLVFEVLTTA